MDFCQVKEKQEFSLRIVSGKYLNSLKFFFLYKIKILCGVFFCLVNFPDFKSMKISRIFVLVYRLENKTKIIFSRQLQGLPEITTILLSVAG